MTDENKKKVKIVNGEEVLTMKGIHSVSSPHDSSLDYPGMYHSSGSYFEKEASFEEFNKFLYSEVKEEGDAEKEKKEKKILPFKKSELDRIKECDTLEKCHIYILEKNKLYSLFDSSLILFDNILKIVPTVLLSSLPVLFLTKLNSNLNLELFGWIYGTMLIGSSISVAGRWRIKNKMMAYEQYYSHIKKKEKEIIDKREDTN